MSLNKPAKQPLVEDTFGEKLEAWYDRNGKWINVLLIVVLVGVVGYKGYTWSHERNIAKANAAYGSALNLYEEGLRNPEAAQKTDSLQGAITAAQQVAADYSDKFVGRQAQLMVGNAEYTIALDSSSPASPKLEKARDSYKKYLGMAQSDAEKATGNIALGNVLENLAFIQNDKKGLQEAVDCYTKAAEAGKGTALAGEAKLAMGRVKSAMNDATAQADAVTLFQDVEKNRDVRLVSEASLKDIKPIKLASGQTLSAEELQGIKNLSTWSQRQEAKDALLRLK